MKTEQEIREITNSRFVIRTSQKEHKILPHKIDHKIYGHHSSYVEDGYRVWGFVSKDGLMKFMLDYNLS